MLHLKKIVTLLICIQFLTFFSGQIWGQDFDLEKLLENEIDLEDNSVILDYLLYLQQHPFDLNKVKLVELTTIPWITPLYAKLIIEYRDTHKGFSSVDELNAIKELQPYVEILKPFFTVEKESEKRFFLTGRHRVILKKQKSTGYERKIYKGNRLKIYNRVEGAAPGDIRFGLLTEKDPGEKAYNDLTTGYGQIHLSRMQSTIYIGNYLVESGQGMVFWGPYQLNKGNDPVVVVKKRSRGILPYKSVDENVYFSGIGIKTIYKSIECAGFYSFSLIDARVENDSVLTLQKTGYHRYGNEIKNKDSIYEKVLGCYVKWQMKSLNLGTHWQSSQHSKPFSQSTSNSYFTKGGNVVGGMDYNITTGLMHFFGEVAKSRYSGINYLQGFLVNLNEFDLIVSLRKYQNDFVNFHGRAFGENYALTNEEAVYFGWKWRVQPSTTLAFYFDLFRHPVYSQATKKPLNGWELMGNMEHRFFKELSVFLRLRIRTTQLFKNTYDLYGNKLKKLLNREKSSIRAQIDYQVKRQLGFRTRFEYSWLDWNDYNTQSSFMDSSAVLFYHDIHYQFNQKFSVRLRWTFFDSPISDLNFYQYENDLPGVLRLKMLNHRGSRFYVISGYRWKNHFNTTLKYEHTFYDNNNIISSGYDTIYSDHENMLSIQFDWNW